MIPDAQTIPGRPASVPRPRLLDCQGCSTLVAGCLLLLISLTTNYGDDNLFQFSNLPAPDKVGLCLHLAALAALAGVDEVFSAGVVQLVSRLRHAALELRMDALLLNADSSSQAPPANGSNEVKLWRF